VARLFVGDTAGAVIRRSRTPCLFVEEGCPALSRILAALDGSERGMRVFDAARDFGDAVGASLSVVTVEDLDAPALPEPVLPLPLTRSSRLWRELGAGDGRGGASTAETAVSIRRGRVVPEVLAEVAATGAGVLAFGCHRGGPLGLLEGGGTAHQLAHAAPVSVLTIPL
jgi:nucleotide-binding universal stress UspA family protein